jgi:hypothetical protein
MAERTHTYAHSYTHTSTHTHTHARRWWSITECDGSSAEDASALFRLTTAAAALAQKEGMALLGVCECVCVSVCVCVCVWLDRGEFDMNLWQPCVSPFPPVSSLTTPPPHKHKHAHTTHTGRPIQPSVFATFVLPLVSILSVYVQVCVRACAYVCVCSVWMLNIG